MNVYKVRQEVINGNHDIHGELIVLAKNIPDAIEVANQYLAKGHDPITSVTLICEDVKLMKSDDTRKRVLAEAMAGLCERKPLTWADLSEEDKKSSQRVSASQVSIRSLWIST